MKKKPNISDCVPIPSATDETIWHRKSLQEDTINNQSADYFYTAFGKELSDGIKDCLETGKSFDDLIERISDLASRSPAIDWEDQQRPENIKIEKDIIEWRKNNYWRINVRNITQSIASRSKFIFDQKKKEYEDYINWYESHSDEEKRNIDQLEDFGLL
jgi:hypothetical protein